MPAGRARACAAAALVLALACARPEPPEPDPARLPRWRGFNLDDKMEADNALPYREDDFRLIAEWGFDFVRLPLDYRLWSEDGLYGFREETLKEIDEAVGWGGRYGLHIDLNLHRAPGWCINSPREKLDLWTDEEAQRAAAYHWARLARRYKGIPNRRLSFNLLNEPDGVSPTAYAAVIRRLVAAVRAEDPGRLIIIDGLDLGTRPVPELADLGVAQSFHAYLPWEVSATRAPWFGPRKWPKPAWPMTIDGERWDRERLRKVLAPWRELQEKGVAVHVGEFGAFNRTPHDVTLAWMRDYLGLFREAGWGWALWNLRGEYGPLDGRRTGAPVEDFRGRSLDRPMLDLLRAS